MTSTHPDPEAAMPHDDPYADRYDDAPEEELPRRPRRRLVTPAALVLAGVAIGAGGFWAGVEVQKGQGDGAGGGGARAAAGGFSGGGFPGGGDGGTRGGGGAPGGGGFPGPDGGGTTTGTVTSKRGRTLYVRTSDGTTVKVTTNAGSSVVRTAGASVKGVHPGDTVLVQGDANAKGTVKATRVTATASSAAR